MSEGLQSPVFVGRRDEVASLVALLRRATEGEPGLAIIAGEAGVGKTRLVGELAGHATGAGFSVLTGHCVELGAEGLPLAPLIDALRTLARTTAPGELAEVLGPARRGLGRLLPELDPGALPADQVTRAHAVVLSALAASVWRANDMAATMSLASRAVQAARDVGAAQQEADSSITLGSARGYLGADEGDLEDLRAGMALATDIGAPATALRGYVNLSDVLELHGRHEEAVQVASEGIALADRVGLARSLGAFLSGNVIESMLRLGRWSEAEQLATKALNAMPEGVFAATVLLLRAELAAMTGRYSDADIDVRAARRALGQTSDEQFALTMLYSDALAALGRGDLGAARRLVADGLADYGSFLSVRYIWPLLWLAARIEADQATLARDRREELPDGTAVRYQELASFAAGLAAPNASALGYKALVTAELARAAGEADVPAWSAAVQAWRLAAEPYPLAYALLRLAEAAAAAGDRPAAARSVREAHALATEVGAIPIADEAIALARRTRLSLEEPAAEPVISPPKDPLARFGLTEREREILALLAAGRSNPQIAQSLFISPKTASVHVSNILAKLGVDSRVEAAAVAHRLGVTG